jgi:undecaprenyl pyrophosphate phosphatase UppP
MHQLTYVQAVFTGIVQGVTELFPISSLGHNVLIPALIGGSWAQNLSVSAPGSPYLAFIVGLHVATALAMIIYFRRDWARIIKAFYLSVRHRQVVTSDQRLAWMIVLATIPVGLVGAALQKVFTDVFAKPTLTAFFLAVNGLILLYSERQRRVRANDGDGYPDGGYYPDAGGYDGGRYNTGGYYEGPPGYGEGYSQQPQQQQWQGPSGPYSDEPPRPSFTPHPPSGQPGRQDQPGRAPQHGGGDSAGDWTEWFTQGEGGQRQAADYGRDARYDRGPAQGQVPAYAPPYADGQYGDQYRGDQYRGDQYRGDQYGGGQYGGGQYGGDQYGGGQYREAQYGGGQYGVNQYGTDQYGSGAGYGPDRTWDARGDVRDAVADDSAVEADERLSRMTWGRAIFVGSAQILALLPGISRDGIVTVAGMSKGIKREDAVRFSFLLSAPVILAAGLFKAHDLFGPEGKGIHGPVLVGSIFAGVGAYLSVRFLTKYFSESRSLKPFGLYCLIAGVGSLAYLLVR